MGRQLSQAQSYADKVMKLVPTEIVGAYMVLGGIIGYPAGATVRVADAASGITDDALRAFLIQFTFAVLFVLTPVYLRRVGKVTSVGQIVLSTATFVVWVYSLGGPFVVWGVYYPLLGSVGLVLWALVVPLLMPSSVKAKAKVVAAAA